MATKIEKVGNYFIMTDSGTGNTIEERLNRNVHYEDDNGKITLFYTEGSRRTKLGKDTPYELTDFVDDEGNIFPTYNDLLFYLRNNTGFNTASGGSEVKLGVFDYNDLSTSTTPLSVLGGESILLPNDGLGPFSNKNFTPTNVTDVWNGVSNQFDFSDLSLGTKVDLRIDLDLEVAGPNAEIDIILNLAIGSTSPYSLNLGEYYYKNAGLKTNQTLNQFIYIGTQETKDYPAEIILYTTNDLNIKVNGWVAYIHLY